MTQRVDVEDGKYTIVIGDRGELHALRYGEPWQDLTGNKMVYCLATELAAAREALALAARLQERIDALESLRPHWAQGHTSDSGAAQAATAALSTLWGMLGVTDQTQAVVKLSKMVRAVQMSFDVLADVPDEIVMGDHPVYGLLLDAGAVHA